MGVEPSGPIAGGTRAQGLREVSRETQPTNMVKSCWFHAFIPNHSRQKAGSQKLPRGTGGSTFSRALVLGSNSCVSSEGHPRAPPGLLHQPSYKHLMAQAAPLPSDPSPSPCSSILPPLPSSNALVQGSCSVHDLLSLVTAGPTHQPTQHPSLSKPRFCRTQGFTEHLQPWPSSGSAQPHVYRPLMRGR